jgi:isopropylmalate/homocitrate/citramalate synthase
LVSSAGATEYDFIRGLVDQGRVPDDVLIQVLTQAREDLIKTSFESLAGIHSAIVHVYNAVSPLWRNVVFGMEKPQVRGIAENCCATMPRASRPSGSSNIALKPSPPPSWISASSAARR